MKKIISVAAAIAMAATMMTSFVTVSAERTATNVAVKTAVMSNDDYKAVTSEDIPDGAVAYTVEVDLSNINTDNYGSGLYRFKDSGSEYVNGLNGLGFNLLGIGAKMYSTTTTSPVPPYSQVTNYFYGNTATAKLGTPTKVENEIRIAFAATEVAAAYPTTTVEYESAITSLDDVVKYYVLVNTTEKFELNYNGEVQYTPYTAGVAGSSVTDAFSGTLEFSGVSTPASEDFKFTVGGVEGPVAGTEVKDASEAVIGVVWADCKLENLDTANNDYVAKFTADGDENQNRKTNLKFGAGIETSGDVTFDAVMYFTGAAKTNVKMNVVEQAKD